MTRRKLTVDYPGASDQTMAEFDVVGESPVDPSSLRIQHATATIEIQTDPEPYFDAFTRFAQYDRWAPDVQGSAHWLTVTEGGEGSKFIAYDKPGTTHLAHYGEVSITMSD